MWSIVGREEIDIRGGVRGWSFVLKRIRCLLYFLLHNRSLRDLGLQADTVNIYFPLLYGLITTYGNVQKRYDYQDYTNNVWNKFNDIYYRSYNIFIVTYMLRCTEIFEQLIIDYINKLLYFTSNYTFKLGQILLRKCLVYFIHVKRCFSNFANIALVVISHWSTSKCCSSKKMRITHVIHSRNISIFTHCIISTSDMKKCLKLLNFSSAKTMLSRAFLHMNYSARSLKKLVDICKNSYKLFLRYL